MTHIICGVDVSARTLDARIGPDGPHAQFPHSPEGLTALAVFCRAHGVTLVVMEATGGYEKLPFALLWQIGLACAVVNARAVRRFAEAMGILEKTDRLDAGVIAWYAAVKRIAPQPPASAEQERLTALVTRLRQLTELRTAQSNQRRLVTEAAVLARIDELLAVIARQLRELEGEIATLLASDPVWQRLNAGLRAIKGVADRTVARLLADLPELGTLSGKAVAKLAGLAPVARDSGARSGPRRVRGGRASIRSILFVVAEVVRRHDPDFQACYQKLLAAGKPKKVIRIALARKLLVRLNAKARDIRAELAQAA